MEIDDNSIKDIQVTYTIVELISKAELNAYKRTYNYSTNIELQRGLFLGIYYHNKNIFYIVTPDNRDLTLINIDKYSIISIAYGYKRHCVTKCQDHLYFRDNEQSQKDAQKLLCYLLINYQQNKSTTEDLEIIDFNKLTDYDIDIIDLHSKKDDSAMHQKFGGGWKNQGTVYTPPLNTTPIVTPAITTPSAAVIKRQSKKPTKIFLDKMLETVILIKNNKGVNPNPLPSLKKKKFNAFEESASNKSSFLTEVDPDESDEAFVNRCMAGFY